MNNAEIKKCINQKIGNRTALLFPEQKLAIFYTEKAGATFLMSWYLAINGLSEIQGKCKPHLFRGGTSPLVEIYQMSRTYQNALRDFRSSLTKEDKGGWTTIKIVRDPRHRAISSFFMILFLQNDALSFREFLSLPTSYFSEMGDVHAYQQVTQLEKEGILKFDRIYKLEEGLEAALEEIERDFKLKSITTKDELYANRRSSKKVTLPEGTLADRVYTSEEVREGIEMPNMESFYDPSLLARVYSLFEDDFNHYGYEFKPDESLLREWQEKQNWPMANDVKAFRNHGVYGETVDAYLGDLPADTKIVLFGLGEICLELLFNYNFLDRQIIAVTESDNKKVTDWSNIFNHTLSIPLISPEDIQELNYDLILITVTHMSLELKRTLISQGVPEDKIVRIPNLIDRRSW